MEAGGGAASDLTFVSDRYKPSERLMNNLCEYAAPRAAFISE